MRVMVTGGAGFIGSHSVDALVAAGHEVAVLDDLSSGRRELVHDAAAFYETDIRSSELGKAFEEFAPSHVLHLAAQMDVRSSLEQPAFYADVNVLGTINVLENCRAHGIQALVFSSTGGAIYGQPDRLPATESTPAAPICPYGASKFSGEVYVQLYGRIHGLRSAILRYGNVYGSRQNPHGEAGVCAILAGLMLEGETPTLFGHGDPVRDYVHVSDVVAANLLALERADGQIVNIASGRGSTVRELFDVIKEQTDFSSDPILKPLRPGEVEKIYLNVDRAREAIAWQAKVELGEGLAETVDYIRERRSQGYEF